MAMQEEAKRMEAVATVTAPSCPIKSLDCLNCKYFQSFDPDNLGEYVVLCRHEGG